MDFFHFIILFYKNENYCSFIAKRKKKKKKEGLKFIGEQMNFRKINKFSFTKNNKKKKTRGRKNKKICCKRKLYRLSSKSHEDFKKYLETQKSNKTELPKEEIKKK